MSGIRGFLIAIANLVLGLMVLGIPFVAFILTGSAVGLPYGNFNVAAGLGGAIVGFLIALPAAAILALFLDIREQLVAINQNTRGAFATVVASASEPTVPMGKSEAAAAPAPIPANDQVKDMQDWFSKAYGRSISQDQAIELIDARSQGNLLTACERILARL